MLKRNIHKESMCGVCEPSHFLQITFKDFETKRKKFLLQNLLRRSGCVQLKVLPNQRTQSLQGSALYQLTHVDLI